MISYFLLQGGKYLLVHFLQNENPESLLINLPTSITLLQLKHFFLFRILSLHSGIII